VRRAARPGRLAAGGAAARGARRGAVVRAAAAARHWLWRLVLALTGGLTVEGALPSGGCVVVANHSSHADTAALLAAIRIPHAPPVAAAADYWFAGGWRPAVCRPLAAAF